MVVCRCRSANQSNAYLKDTLFKGPQSTGTRNVELPRYEGKQQWNAASNWLAGIWGRIWLTDFVDKNKYSEAFVMMRDVRLGPVPQGKWNRKWPKAKEKSSVSWTFRVQGLYVPLNDGVQKQLVLAGAFRNTNAQCGQQFHFNISHNFKSNSEEILRHLSELN